jgi:hypothetical protein
MILETNKQTRDVVGTELCAIKLLLFANSHQHVLYVAFRSTSV